MYIYADDRYLKLSDKKHTDKNMDGADVLREYYRYFKTYGLVTYTTNVPIANIPEYVYIVSKSLKSLCYKCHVKPLAESKEIEKYVPKQFRGEEKITNLLFDSMYPLLISSVDIMNKNDKLSSFSQRPRATQHIIRS